MTRVNEMFKLFSEAIGALEARVKGNIASRFTLQDLQHELSRIQELRLRAEHLLSRDAYIEGQLRRQATGRWMLSQDGDHQYVSGSPIEIYQNAAWVTTTIEHSKRGGYYRADGGPLNEGDWVRVPRGVAR